MTALIQLGVATIVDHIPFSLQVNKDNVVGLFTKCQFFLDWADFAQE